VNVFMRQKKTHPTGLGSRYEHNTKLNRGVYFIELVPQLFEMQQAHLRQPPTEVATRWMYANC
jgi:hypothetical protein